MPMRRLVLAIVAAACVAAGVAIALKPGPAQPPPPQTLQSLSADDRVQLEKWWDLQPKVDLPFTTEPAKVVVIKFNDYQCPPCRNTYFGYEPIVAKYKDRPNDVRFVLKHFPLNSHCNPAVPGVTHPAACDAAAAAVMAGPRGTFDKLTDWFFVHQEDLSPDFVRDAAKSVGNIPDFDKEYDAALVKVRADATDGQKLGVPSTPTFFVNGRKIAQAISPEAMDGIIQIELARASGPKP